jgi:type 1 glutamine amidotransferase
MVLLATAHSDAARGGTGRDEPVLLALSYGKGRVFHTLLGRTPEGMTCVGFQTMLERGAEWAATGKVTVRMPADFPTEDKTSTRPSK